MKTWIVSSLDEETIQVEETIQGGKLYEEYGNYILILQFLWFETEHSAYSWNIKWIFFLFSIFIFIYFSKYETIETTV